MRADKLLTVKQRELLTNQLFEGSTKILHHGVRLCFALLSKVGLANAHVNSSHHLTIIIKFINTIIIASLHLDILMRSSKAKCIDSLCSAGHPSVEEKSDNGLVLVVVVGGDVYRFVCGGEVVQKAVKTEITPFLWGSVCCQDFNLAAFSVTPVIAEENLKAMSLNSCIMILIAIKVL